MRTNLALAVAQSATPTHFPTSLLIRRYSVIVIKGTPTRYHYTISCYIIRTDGSPCSNLQLYLYCFIPKDGLSSSSGRTEEMMSDEGSSSDSAEFPGNIFHSTQHKGEEYSAANEVVCGHQLSRSFLKDQV